ncbi:MAG TPA: hypothetical protein VKF28_07465 [Candidatus Dormibacteraeota bacterium]|nr:hypothetical protein [Candidatus Dormibacteraeota bacterium]
MKRRAGRPNRPGVAQQPHREWLAIRVELVGGRGEQFWPRPGRFFAAASTHSFARLATAIDNAFARWDISHLHQFELSGGVKIGRPDPDFDDDILDERREHISRLHIAEQFVYVFDFCDDWTHLCTVVNPPEFSGGPPAAPAMYFGWGSTPDQYGRRWDEDDGESPLPPDPGLTDLPPLQPGWGLAR